MSKDWKAKLYNLANYKVPNKINAVHTLVGIVEADIIFTFLSDLSLFWDRIAPVGINTHLGILQCLMGFLWRQSHCNDFSSFAKVKPKFLKHPVETETLHFSSSCDSWARSGKSRKSTKSISSREKFDIF